MMGSTNAMWGMIRGSAPGNVSGFRLTSQMGSLTLFWSDPTDDTWAGTILVRKADDFPVNENDGTVVVDSTARDAYKIIGFKDMDADDTQIEYCYQVFPYSKTGLHNRDPSNRVSGTPMSPV